MKSCDHPPLLARNHKVASTASTKKALGVRCSGNGGAFRLLRSSGIRRTEDRRAIGRGQKEPTDDEARAFTRDAWAEAVEGEQF
jgi:hypothetical protein